MFFHILAFNKPSMKLYKKANIITPMAAKKETPRNENKKIIDVISIIGNFMMFGSSNDISSKASASTCIKLTISPYENCLLVAPDIFITLSYMSTTNEFELYTPIITC